MGFKDKKRTPAEKANAKRKVVRNKLKKYSTLLDSKPNDPHRKTWEKKLEEIEK